MTSPRDATFSRNVDAAVAPPRPGTRRVRLLAFAALLATFAGGTALGWGLGHRGARVGQQPDSARVQDGRGRHGHGRRGDPLERLNLTPAQRVTVDSIFAVRRGQVDAFWQGPGRQLTAILDSTRADVRAVLTPAQRVLGDSLMAERQRRDRGRSGGRRAPLFPGRGPFDPPGDGVRVPGPPGGPPPAGTPSAPARP